MATQTEVGRHLDLTQAAVSQLVAAGVLPAADRRGGLDLDACRTAYVRHLRGTAAGRDSSRPGSLEAERARLTAAQAEAAERRNARERGDLGSVSEISAAVCGVMTLVVDRLTLVGARVAGGDAKLRKRIEAEVDHALEHLSQTRVVDVLAQAGGGIPEDDDAHDADAPPSREG